MGDTAGFIDPVFSNGLFPRASLDSRYDDSINRVDFTFEGSDEGDQVTGRGWAKIEGKQMVGQIGFHLGDESGFKAKKAKR